MNEIGVGLFVICAVIAISLVGGVFSEFIIKLIRLRVSGFAYQGSEFLIGGLLLATALVYGLFLMHLWVTP